MHQSITTRRLVQHALIWLALALLISPIHLKAETLLGLKFWRVKDLIETNAFNIELKGYAKDGSLIAAGSVTREQLLLLYEVCERVSAISDTGADLFIINGDSPNAFATSFDGRNVIAVNTAMLQLLSMDPDATAALIGHELAHLKLRHLEQQKETKEKMTALSLIFSIAVGAKLGSYGVTDPYVYQGAGQLIDLLAAGTLFAYSREQEREADSAGLSTMERSGFNPNGAIRLWQNMIYKSGGGNFSLFNTHPQPLERLQIMQSAIKANYPIWQEKPFDKTALQKKDSSEIKIANIESIAINEPILTDKKERSASFHAPTECTLASGEKVKIPKIQCVRQGGNFSK